MYVCGSLVGNNYSLICNLTLHKFQKKINIGLNGIGLDGSPLTARDGGKDVGFGSQSSIDTVQPATIMHQMQVSLQ